VSEQLRSLGRGEEEVVPTLYRAHRPPPLSFLGFSLSLISRFSLYISLVDFAAGGGRSMCARDGL
jgi:hypothetical protein